MGFRKKNKKFLNKKARARAVGKFSEHVVVKQYQSVYKKVLEK